MPRRPRQAPRHTTRRLQLRHDAPCRTCARLSPPLLLLLERRNPPPSPGSLASELASHNPSADCFLFDPDAFKSWDPAINTQLDLQPYCCTTCHRICKLQFNPTSSRHALCKYDFAYSGILCSSDTLTQTSKQAASHMCISPMEQSIGIIAVRSNHTALHYVGHINISTDLDYDKDQTNPTPAPATQQLVLTAARHISSLLSLQLAFSSQQQSAPAALYIDVQLCTSTSKQLQPTEMRPVWGVHINNQKHNNYCSTADRVATPHQLCVSMRQYVYTNCKHTHTSTF